MTLDVSIAYSDAPGVSNRWYWNTIEYSIGTLIKQTYEQFKNANGSLCHVIETTISTLEQGNPCPQTMQLLYSSTQQSPCKLGHQS